MIPTGGIDGAYLRGLLRRRSIAVRGAVQAKNADGSYLVQREDSLQNVIAQRGNILVDLQVGQVVTLSIPDRSGATSGAGYTIISPEGTNTPNSSQAARYLNAVNNVTENYSRIVVGGVTVSSLQLTHGGAAVTILVYGTNLVSSAVYGDPGITDNIGQTITSTLITIAPKASVGMAKGRYSLTVAGQTIANFFEVI